MKKNGQMKIKVAMALIAITICVALTGVNSGFAAGPVQADQKEVLKKTCLAATVTAIKLEIKRYQGWIDLRKKKQVISKDLPALEAAQAKLKSDLEKYQKMAVSSYTLPNKTEAIAWVRGKASDNSILYIDNMSRSGPWYHLSGIAGGDYSVLKPEARQTLVFYKVYPRYYGYMSSDYVCVAEWRK